MRRDIISSHIAHIRIQGHFYAVAKRHIRTERIYPQA